MLKIYTTPVCPYCQRAKEYLREKGVEFEEINVAENEEARKFMVETSGKTSVPQFEFEDEWIVGYDQLLISNKLGL